MRRRSRIWDRLANEGTRAVEGRSLRGSPAHLRAGVPATSRSTLLFNLAQVLHKAGRPAIAVIYYQKFLDVRGPANSDERRKVQEYLKRKLRPKPMGRRRPSLPRPRKRARRSARKQGGQFRQPTDFDQPNGQPAMRSKPQQRHPAFIEVVVCERRSERVPASSSSVLQSPAPRRPDLSTVPEASLRELRRCFVNYPC